MEAFVPGAEYGIGYQWFIWVCVNPSTRSFEKCDPGESMTVLRAFQSEIQKCGLSRSVFVLNSGCLLGCKAKGTTVAIGPVGSKPVPDQPQTRFFRNVTVPDVSKLIQSCFLNQP